jgi:hypothetical protein
MSSPVPLLLQVATDSGSLRSAWVLVTGPDRPLSGLRLPVTLTVTSTSWSTSAEKTPGSPGAA